MTSITRPLHEHYFQFLIISRSVLLRMRNFSDKSCRENQNTYFAFNICFQTPRHLLDKVVGKKGKSRSYRYLYNTEHAHCMLDTKGYKHIHTLRTRNTYCFSTATMVMRTRLVPLHISAKLLPPTYVCT